MKNRIFVGLLAFGLCVVLPGMMLGVLSDKPREQVVELPAETTTAAMVPLSIPVMGPDGSLQQMELNDYVLGVVLGEMPASFHIEALKAQAVVARTYGLRQCLDGDKHNGAVCKEADCCQAWCDQAAFLSSGGTEEQLEKIRSAVEMTGSEVLYYEGNLIEATFFACSGGSTEDAVAVWGTDVAYLQAVPSPGEEAADAYMETFQFDTTQICGLLGITSGTLEVGTVKYTRGGGVDQITLSGQVFTGIELRHLLNLPSTAFYLTAIGDTVTITTRGHGHRVGMSQYGADAMATEGSTYGQILAHYYQNTVLAEYNP